MKRKQVKKGIASIMALFLIMGYTASPMRVAAMTEDTVMQESEEGKLLESELATVRESQIPDGYVVPALEDWKYTKNEDGTVTLWHYDGEDEKVYIPAYYGEAKVVLQADEGEYAPIGVFDHCMVTGVAFDPEIKDADMYAMFADCENLTEVLDIPSGVTTMELAFMYCSSLTEAPEIPAGVTNMSYTFVNCTNLIKAPVIPSGVTNMMGTFLECSSLTKAPVIPSSVTNMVGTFMYCSSLTKVPNISAGVTDMSYTFVNCSSLIKTPVIPSGVTDMQYTFSNCSSLAKVSEIPGSVIYMNSTFEGCSNLMKGPVIRPGVTNMNHTFRNCENLRWIPMIPSSVTDMNGTFEGCSDLIKAPAIPSGVKEMGRAFSGCKNLTGSITIYCIPKYYEQVFDEAATNRKMGLRINYTSKNKKIMEEIIKKSTGNIKKGIKVAALYKY